MIGLAERKSEASPQTGLQTHIDQISSFILDKGLKDLILVGHSYAGLVMVGIAERLPDCIGHLVYLDALVPDHGQSAFDLIPGAESSFVGAMRSTGSDFLVPPLLSPRDLGLTERTDIEWVKKLLTPMPILTHREKVYAPQQKAFQIPSTLINCRQFGLGANFIPKARSKGWRIHEIDSGHDVMITNPNGLLELLEGANQAT